VNRVTTRVNGRVIEHIGDEVFVDGQPVATARDKGIRSALLARVWTAVLWVWIGMVTAYVLLEGWK
jgi:CII-binding regulator of phage lambda lysogenization HflD